MMDAMGNYPGPTKDAAKQELLRDLKPVLQTEANAPVSLAAEVNKMIDDSIDEGVNNLDWTDRYSLSGWIVFGKKECTDEIRRIFTDKLRRFKKNKLKKKF